MPRNTAQRRSSGRGHGGDHGRGSTSAAAGNVRSRTPVPRITGSSVSAQPLLAAAHAPPILIFDSDVEDLPVAALAGLPLARPITDNEAAHEAWTPGDLGIERPMRDPNSHQRLRSALSAASSASRPSRASADAASATALARSPTQPASAASRSRDQPAAAAARAAAVDVILADVLHPWINDYGQLHALNDLHAIQNPSMYLNRAAQIYMGQSEWELLQAAIILQDDNVLRRTAYQNAKFPPFDGSCFKLS